MKLIIDPSPSLPVFHRNLDLVIRIGADRPPEMHVGEGLPKPDRHLLLGMAQSVAMAVTEKDRDLVVFMDAASIVLETGLSSKKLDPGLIVIRDEDGRLGILAGEDPRGARLLAREALRSFTGGIRLDIP
jgi:hypothetical protein